jgi:hypothetical protein
MTLYHLRHEESARNGRAPVDGGAGEGGGKVATGNLESFGIGGAQQIELLVVEADVDLAIDNAHRRRHASLQKRGNCLEFVSHDFSFALFHLISDDVLYPSGHFQVLRVGKAVREDGRLQEDDIGHRGRIGEGLEHFGGEA